MLHYILVCNICVVKVNFIFYCKIYMYLYLFFYIDKTGFFYLYISEQECVSKYINGYFKNKRFIKTKQDIYI